MTMFHLALTVKDLDEARRFYCDTLGCVPTRRAATWQDIDFFGHQLSLHLDQTGPTDKPRSPFVIKPHGRFVGQPFEQSTFFMADPPGNHLECKGVGPDVDLLAPDNAGERNLNSPRPANELAQRCPERNEINNDRYRPTNRRPRPNRPRLARP